MEQPVSGVANWSIRVLPVSADLQSIVQDAGWVAFGGVQSIISVSRDPSVINLKRAMEYPRAYNRRRFVRESGALALAVGLAGCGGDDDSQERTDPTNNDDPQESTDSASNDEQSPEPDVEQVDLFVGDFLPDTINFTEQDILEPAYAPTLKVTYTDGETEEVELAEEDYEVTDAYVQRTNGEEFYGADYGKNGLPNSFEVEFEDEDEVGDSHKHLLDKAGFYQELDSIKQLDSSKLLAGLNEVGATLSVDESAIQNYTEVPIDTRELNTELTVEDTVEAGKTNKEYIEDHLPTKEDTVELWKKFRGYTTDYILSSPTGGNIEELVTYRDLSEKIMSAVDTSENDKELLRQISDEWVLIAGDATGGSPADRTMILEAIIDDNTDLIPFTVANGVSSTVAVYQPVEGNIIYMEVANVLGRAKYDVANLWVGKLRTYERKESPILNPNQEFNRELAQNTISQLYKDMDNEFTLAANIADLDSSVSFMDDIRANDAPGANVEAVKEGIDTNLRAAVANVMRDDRSIIFRGIKKEGGWSIETADAYNFDLRDDF